MIERKIIDLQKFRLIEEAGMIPRHVRYSYAAEVFQRLMREAFGDLVPRIERDDNGKYFHTNRDEESRDTVSLSREFEPGEAWPRDEVGRLLAGWENLHAIATSIEDPRLREMLRNLQFPNPRRNRQCYRTYIDTNGIQRLHVLYGFAPVGVRETYAAADLMALLRERYFPDSIRHEETTDWPGEEMAEPVRGAGRLMNRMVSPALSLACVLSLAAVFLTYSITAYAALAESQASGLVVCPPGAPGAGMQKKSAGGNAPKETRRITTETLLSAEAAF